MFPVLHARDDGTLYLTTARHGEDVGALVGDRYPEVLTSSDRVFDFWFSSRAWHQRINQVATEVLFARCDFNARSTPLLRGDVVVCTRDSRGSPSGIIQGQLDCLSEGAPWGSDRRVLGLRYAREEHRQHARVRAYEETRENDWRFEP
ncbi:MAG: hypothetical protein K0U78_21290 [Actinomycetia bacterium]|nr:hypothetical protein [Actinomycetes bacterium]